MEQSLGCVDGYYPDVDDDEVGACGRRRDDGEGTRAGIRRAE